MLPLYEVHEVVNENRPSLHLAVVSKIVLGVVPELVDHLPGIPVYGLLVSCVLYVLHELIVKPESSLKIDPPKLLSNFVWQNLSLWRLLVEVKEVFIHVSEGLFLIKLLSEDRNLLLEIGHVVDVQIRRELIKLLLGDSGTISALHEIEEVAPERISQFNVQLLHHAYNLLNSHLVAALWFE